jgi:HTH-type transcriptional regulator / antitoxin HigA
MTQAELAERLGKSRKHVNEVIKGVAGITPEMALQLERVLGVAAHFWNNREQQYREHLARQEERERLLDQVDWLRNFPVKEMCKRRWIEDAEDPVDQLRSILGFFGVASPEVWKAKWLAPEAAFRQSPAFEANPYAVAAWLRQGEIAGQELQCAPYDRAAFRAVLQRIRAATVQPPEVVQRDLVRLSAEAGVALVFVPSLPKTRSSGATRWLSSDKALIQLSLRYKTDDQLWFSFFHEAGHILLHGKRNYFVAAEDGCGNRKETEADEFAADYLIPPREWQSFARPGYPYSHDEIRDFAQRLQIAPGIVVGRLQHEGYLSHSHCNELKRRLTWSVKDNDGAITDV